MKTRLLAVLSVSLLVLASAAPMALAQDAVAGGGGRATGGDVQVVDCSQVINVVQGQYGDATAIGRRAVAVIANEQNITVNQVNACLGEVGQNPGGNGGDNGGNNNGGNNTTNRDEDRDCEDFDTLAEAQASLEDDEACESFFDDEDVAAAQNDVVESSIPKVASLPNTGGPSLLALSAGLALVAGGASLIRFRR